MALTEQIALAIDVSDPSRPALAATLKLAEMCGTKRVSILYATRDVVVPEGDQALLRAQIESLRARIDAGASQVVERLLADFPPPRFAIDRVVVHGKPAVVIPKKAKEIGATLLVLGTHARKGIKRLLYGSVAETILRGVELPVVVATVGEDGRPPDAELGAIERVLVAVDLHPHAGEVFRRGLELAKAFAPQIPAITLLTVTDVPPVLATDPTRPPDPLADLEQCAAAVRDAAQRQLEALAEAHANDGVKITLSVEDGAADDTIVRVADEIEAQLVVVGTHGRGRAALLEIGSTTAHVVRSSNVSVLVVPTPPSS